MAKVKIRQCDCLECEYKPYSKRAWVVQYSFNGYTNSPAYKSWKEAMDIAPFLV